MYFFGWELCGLIIENNQMFDAFTSGSDHFIFMGGGGNITISFFVRQSLVAYK